MLIMITGLPGTGKTTFAKSLAKQIKAVHLNSDMIRIQLGKQGKYDKASKDAVYSALQTKTNEMLKQKKPVVIDATLYKNTLRNPFIELAAQFEMPVKWIEMKAKEQVIKERVSKKREYSEADFEVYLKINADYELLEMDHLTLWSDSLEMAEMLETAKDYLDWPRAENKKQNK